MTARECRRNFSQVEAAAATRALVARDERPTAIVYDSDVAALAGVTVLTEAWHGELVATTLPSLARVREGVA